MKRELRVGDQVIYKGEVYTITRKRSGLDFYEIAKIHSQNGQQFLTCVHDGLYASSLELVPYSMIENAQDIQRELQRTSKDGDC